MIRFIENIGDYFSQHFFNEDFPKKVFDKSGYVTQKKDDDNIPMENHITTINSKVAPLREKYFRFKNEFLNIKRTKDRVKLTHDFHTDLLKTLDYKNGIKEYDNPVYLNENEVVPVRYQYYKWDRPYLFVMEMQAMIKEGDDDPQGIFDQVYLKDDWEKVFPEEWKDILIKPDVINEALTELFILPEEERPEYVIMLAAPKIFLIHYEKWKYDSFLLFNLEELFTESQVPAHKDYLSLFYALLSKPQFISETESILHVLEEDAHKAMYGVTQALKNSVIYAVESLANEAIYYKLIIAKGQEEKAMIEQLMASVTFARELKDECLTFVYRLLFLFYAESREDLEILPVKDTVYQKGYSLEMLRDLEMVPLTSDSSRNGNFFSQSLWKLFSYLHKGQENENGFTMKPLDSPLFDNESLTHLKEVEFRNFILQEIIVRLSLSERTKNKGRGRISYYNLGINQLGSVYESLLAYSGFFAAETLIEVKAADDKDGKEGTYLVPKKRRDDFYENEILKDPEQPERDIEIEKGKFVYRLNGRDRKKTASYYTPEVLTQTTVKYTLKGILDKLKERQNNGEDCADEILNLKILEPAMGAAAFHNEVINQLAVAYLELKEYEVVKRGGKRVVPGLYKDEIQKVKAFIASHNVYGVDLNPTAIELGKISLWLNCMHRDMETPFFAHRLGVGNAVVGAWLKVYDPKDFLVEFPKQGTPTQRRTPILKDWWNKAPYRAGWKNGKLERKDDQIYHFLLPDENLVPSIGIKLLKENLSDAEIRKFNDWKKEFKSPIRGDEHIRLKRICSVIDVLLEEHYQQTAKINRETASHYNLYGQIERSLDFKNYKEKERLAKLRNDRSAPYYKLKTIMDYWCSLWFWDIRKVDDLPSREEWYNELESVLGLEIDKLSVIETTTETNTGFEQSLPEQQKLFGGPKQISLGAKPRIQNQKEKIKQLIADYSGDPSSLYQHGRIKYVQELSENYKFFHNELEFIEVFKEGGGFNVIVGNPPWVKVVSSEDEIISEEYPEFILHNMSSTVKNSLVDRFMSVPRNVELLKIEFLQSESEKAFYGNSQIYGFLKGMKPNLYKNFYVTIFDIYCESGFAGIVSPDGLYDDTDGDNIREELYSRLKYHFQFENSGLFRDIHSHVIFSLNILGRKGSDIFFDHISNLFSVFTLNSIYTNNDGKLYGLINDNYEPEFGGNNERIIKISTQLLDELYPILGGSSDYRCMPLPVVHDRRMIIAIKKIHDLKRLADYSDKISNKESFRETQARLSRELIKQDNSPENIDDLVIGSSHINVGSFLYKEPNENCKSNTDFREIDLTRINDSYIPRSLFVLTEKGKQTTDFIKDYYLVNRMMVDTTWPRTYIPAIIPKEVKTIHALFSNHFKSRENLITFSIYSFSIIYDFIIKIKGKPNVIFKQLSSLPLPEAISKELLVRGLRLICITNHYSDLWSEFYVDTFKKDYFSTNNYILNNTIDDPEPGTWSHLEKKWNHNTPIRSNYGRRQILIEIDVLVAMYFKITLNELLMIYKIQFSGLQKQENKMRFNKVGENIRKAETTYEEKDQILLNPNREEDYGIAWKYFENYYANNK